MVSYLQLMKVQNLKIVNHFNKHVPFSAEQLAVFFDYTEREVIEKNKYLTKTGNADTSFYLIESGCLVSYVTDEDDQKHVIQFSTDLWWTGDIEAIMKRTPSTWSIKATTRTIVYKLSTDHYEKLVNSHVQFERYFRILFQNSLIYQQKRIIGNISFSAKERYLSFMTQCPKIELKVTQKHIASYLGVTPEFLSKLKKQLAQRKNKTLE